MRCIPTYDGTTPARAGSLVHHAPAGPAHPLHLHDYYSVAVVTGVDQRYQRGRAVYAAPVGSVLFAEPGEPHRSIGPTLGFVWVQLAHDAFDALGPPPRFPRSVVWDPELRALLLRAAEAGSAADSVREGALRALTAYLYRVHGTPHAASAVADPVVWQVAAYLRAHLHESVALARLGARWDRHPDYLCRAFKKHVGMAPHQYHLSARISRARCMLRAGVAPADVAYSLGFADQSHLTRLFQRVFHRTPGRFQREVNFLQE